MSNPDINRVLNFWFAEAEQDSIRVDSRMDRWFGSDPDYDQLIRDEFGDLIEQASCSELDNWADAPPGRLALIIILDQFRRNVYRGTADAFSHDKKALQLSIEGTMEGAHKDLSPLQRLFFFMPLQHAESLKIQDKSVGIFNALAKIVPDTLTETFMTSAQFAELHRDIVAEFGRFPHRNAVLGRTNTAAENDFLSAEGPSFGQ